MKVPKSDRAVLAEPAGQIHPMMGESVVTADFVNVRGQEACKRAFLIAITGCHPMVVFGPSGHGKSMMAKSAKVIEPRLKVAEATTWKSDSLQKQGNTAHGLHKMAVCGDIHIEVPALPFRELVSKRPGTSSTTMSDRVKDARRYAALNLQSMELSDDCLLLMRQAYEELGMNPRSFSTIARIARTIANLEDEAKINACHLAEAVQYRLLDRKF